MITKIEYDISTLIANKDIEQMKSLAEKMETESAKLRNLIGETSVLKTDPIHHKSLYDALSVKNSECQGLMKHLFSYGITNWCHLTKSNLYDFKDYLLTQVCTSSARTYLKRLRLIMKKYEEDNLFPCKEYADVLKLKDEKPQRVYLTQKELWQFESVKPRNKNEQLAKDMFLVECYTGARVSDVMKMTPENINGNILTYVSKKTHTQASVRLKPCVPSMIDNIKSRSNDIIDIATYNRIIKRLCRRADINESVKIFAKGKESTKEKWEFISSHTGRISFATNLSDLGTTIQDIAKMMGHSDIKTTMRYIVSNQVNLNSNGLRYFE